PSGDWLRPLAQLTRSAVGMSFDFDFQVILLAAEIPELQFPSREDSHEPPRLGWNTWLLSQAATTDSDDAVFVDRGEPNQV
ncbi:MAG: type VI secretion system baseplate subunit TssG, partial [Planctomycetota bacterium]